MANVNKNDKVFCKNTSSRQKNFVYIFNVALNLKFFICNFFSLTLIYQGVKTPPPQGTFSFITF